MCSPKWTVKWMITVSEVAMESNLYLKIIYQEDITTRQGSLALNTPCQTRIRRIRVSSARPAEVEIAARVIFVLEVPIIRLDCRT